MLLPQDQFCAVCLLAGAQRGGYFLAYSYSQPFPAAHFFFWPLSPTVTLELYITCSLGLTKLIFNNQKFSAGVWY